MVTRRALKKDLGHARQFANLERVRANELQETLDELTDALDAADAERVRRARATAAELREANRRRTQGVR